MYYMLGSNPRQGTRRVYTGTMEKGTVGATEVRGCEECKAQTTHFWQAYRGWCCVECGLLDTSEMLDQDECPQCEGSGMMPMHGGQTEIRCDLCDGTGSWVAPIRTRSQDEALDETPPF